MGSKCAIGERIVATVWLKPKSQIGQRIEVLFRVRFTGRNPPPGRVEGIYSPAIIQRVPGKLPGVLQPINSPL